MNHHGYNMLFSGIALRIYQLVQDEFSQYDPRVCCVSRDSSVLFFSDGAAARTFRQ